jgi:hypothetical protein
MSQKAGRIKSKITLSKHQISTFQIPALPNGIAHKEITHINSFYIFGQQRNLLHFQDILHNLYFIFQKMLFISEFNLFMFQ